MNKNLLQHIAEDEELNNSSNEIPSINMKCPYCNHEMRAGFINTGRTRMFFSTKDRWDTMKKSDDIVLRKQWHKTGPSFYCENCNIIITKLKV